MLEDIYHWATNGGEYMTKTHCWAHDEPWLFAMGALQILIVICYLWIAYIHCAAFKSWQRRNKELNIKRKLIESHHFAHLIMAMIFVLCGFCGYLLSFLTTWYPVHRIEVVSHGLLALAAFIWPIWVMGYFTPNTPSIASKLYQQTGDTPEWFATSLYEARAQVVAHRLERSLLSNEEKVALSKDDKALLIELLKAREIDQ